MAKKKATQKAEPKKVVTKKVDTCKSCDKLNKQLNDQKELTKVAKNTVTLKPKTPITDMEKHIGGKTAYADNTKLVVTVQNTNSVMIHNRGRLVFNGIIDTKEFYHNLIRNLTLLSFNLKECLQSRDDMTPCGAHFKYKRDNKLYKINVIQPNCSIIHNVNREASYLYYGLIPDENFLDLLLKNIM